MRVLIIGALLALAACSGKPPPAPEAVAAKPAASVAQAGDFSQDIDARGNEPFWGLKIRGLQFTLSRPDQPDLTATALGATITPGKAAWTATAPDGRTLKVTLYVSPCSDGMSDLSYPMAAEVQPPDASTLSGCAAKTAPMPKAPAG